MLGHGRATAEHVLGALDGAWLAHIARRHVRADNHVSSRLDNGPLTMTTERLARARYWLVLASCDPESPRRWAPTNCSAW